MTRIVFVLSYPTYVSVADQAEWLRWDNRDRRMPALLSAMGVDVELWSVAHETATVRSPAAFGAPYTIRLFAPDKPRTAARDHFSDAMVRAARADSADLFVVIGTNGGAGYRLFDRALRPDRRRFAVIVGGDYWSRLVPAAALLLTESAVQERALAHPPLWRAAIPAARMLRLPKTIDMERFQPRPAPRRWDLLSVSRLSRWKSFAEVAALSPRYRVAVAGGGDRAAALARRHPAVDWLGHVPNARVPALFDQAAVYFHAGRRDYFPRAIVEAMACGKPVIGFAGRMGDDVIPPDCGLRVTDRSFVRETAALLDDPARIAAMGAAARAHAAATHGARSSEPACRALLRLAEAAA